ncbi:MAG TPA: ImmA/IrrE family metallo-endopeptidase [Bacillota bacterium]|nr:ImmA/IrrE family metallo-endopeptidase [Bacillota bacterium]
MGSAEVAAALVQQNVTGVSAPIAFSFPAADLLRTLELDFAAADLTALAGSASVRAATSMSALPEPRPLDDRLEWIQGYELAESLCEWLHLEPDEPPDLAGVYGKLRILTKTVHLRSKVRGASLASADLAPVLFVNADHPQNATIPARRFAEAHELCHLMFDRSVTGRVAVASGVWAAPDLERRANAFAAYLLMPPGAVQRVWTGVGQGTVAAAVAALADQFGTSVSATAYHLYNLSVLSLAEREAALTP